MYKLSLLSCSVGHKFETHKVTPSAGNERGDIEIKDHVILTHGEVNRLPPHTLMMTVRDTKDVGSNFIVNNLLGFPTTTGEDELENVRDLQVVKPTV